MYSTRHFAHYECFLKAGKSLAKLTDFQVGKFPYRLLQERGLLKQVIDRLGRVGETVTGRVTTNGPVNIREATRWPD